MTESEKYWIGLVGHLDELTEPLRPAGGTLQDEPPWVDKLTFELFRMTTPKMQLRAGMKPTPDKIGVLVGSHLVQVAQAKAYAELPSPETEAGQIAFKTGRQLASPPGIDSGWPESVLKNLAPVEELVHGAVAKILKERPLAEASEFFRGFSRGLKRDATSLVPVVENGRLKYSAKQLELMGRIMVYMVARHNWRELDKLHTAGQAFEWFAKRVPEEFLGNDPERVRKMFYRVGKRFKTPGRPKKGTARR